MSYTQTLGEFYTIVRGALARGTSLDLKIPYTVRRAVKFIERNYSLKYMEKYGTVLVEAASEHPDEISVASPFVKSVIYLRYTDPYLQNYKYLGKIHAREQQRREYHSLTTRDFPQKYWQVGRNILRLDIPVQDDIDFEIQWFEFTSWPVENSEGLPAPWLIANAEDLVLAQTMMFFAPELRDPRLTEIWRGTRDEALKTVSMANDEADEEDSGSVMIFK